MTIGDWAAVLLKQYLTANKKPGHLLDYTDFIGMYQKQGEIKAQLKHTYDMAVSVYNDIRNTQQWAGKNKTAMLSYLHLVIQLHGALIGERMLPQDYWVECDFAEEPRNAYKEAAFNLESLPGMSECLKELEAVR